MAEVTARLARPIGLDSFADLTDVRPSTPRPNPDGTVTITFTGDLLPETLALIRERMETRDDAEAQAQRALAALLTDVEASEPANENIALLRDAVLALGCLVLGQEAAPPA